MNNSRELTLSWYRGGDRLKTMSLPDASSMLSLALEIKSDDGDEFSCVAENPVEEKSTKLHTKDTCLRDGGMTMIKLKNIVLLFSVSIHFAIVQ